MERVCYVLYSSTPLYTKYPDCFCYFHCNYYCSLWEACQPFDAIFFLFSFWTIVRGILAMIQHNSSIFHNLMPLTMKHIYIAFDIANTSPQSRKHTSSAIMSSHCRQLLFCNCFARFLIRHSMWSMLVPTWRQCCLFTKPHSDWNYTFSVIETINENFDKIGKLTKFL